jgi:hypothetical protein
VRSRAIAKATREAPNRFAWSALNIESRPATSTSQKPTGPRKRSAASATSPSGFAAAAASIGSSGATPTVVIRKSKGR